MSKPLDSPTALDYARSVVGRALARLAISPEDLEELRRNPELIDIKKWADAINAVRREEMLMAAEIKEVQ